MSEDVIHMSSADKDLLGRFREELASARARLGLLRERYLIDERLLLDEIGELDRQYRGAIQFLAERNASVGNFKAGRYDYRPDIGAFVRQPGREE